MNKEEPALLKSCKLVMTKKFKKTVDKRVKEYMDKVPFKPDLDTKECHCHGACCANAMLEKCNHKECYGCNDSQPDLDTKEWEEHERHIANHFNEEDCPRCQKYWNTPKQEALDTYKRELVEKLYKQMEGKTILYRKGLNSAIRIIEGLEV